MKAKTARQLANEAWSLLPNDCKKIMRPIKKSYIKTLEAEIKFSIDKAYSNGFGNGLY